MISRIFALICLLLCTSHAFAAPEDEAAIRQTALNYIEGWYEGDAARVQSALHPKLAKRSVWTRDGKSTVVELSAASLVEAAAKGGGSKTPKDLQQKDVVILDVFGNAASVRATMRGWVEYMHMAKVDGRWVIVNMVLEPKAAK
jgi:hypothetical protein